MRSPLQVVYDAYSRGPGSILHKLHRKFVRSPRVVKFLFDMEVERPEKLDSYFDLTTLLMKWVIRRRLRRRPDLRLLEIGAGTFAVLSGCLARYAKTPIVAGEVDARRAESSRRHIANNDTPVELHVSDVFSGVPQRAYDLIFWNLPYYNDPSLLHRLFSEAPHYLAEEGELIIGYNSKPLPRATVLGILEKYPQLVLADAVTWKWNLHDVLVIRRSRPAKVPVET